MKFLLRLLKRLSLGLLALIAVILLGMYFAAPVLTGRMVGMAFGGSGGPVEAVVGNKAVEMPVAMPDERTIPAAVLEQAIAAGEQDGSDALLIWHQGKLQLEHYFGIATAATITNTQSMHKSVLALLVGIAIQQGYIGSVDDRAARYLPEWAGDERSEITIREMLHQESGIDFPTVDFNPVGGFFQMLMGDDIRPIALNQKMLAKPDTQFDYNGINPVALGIIIERATGKPYPEYLSEALWQHMGAGDAQVALDSSEHKMTRTFCCLGAPARAWLRLGLLHINNGQLEGQQIVPTAWMTEVTTPGAHNPNYGYFTWLGNQYEEFRRYNRKTSTQVHQSEPFAAKDMVYFDGFGGQRVYAVPSLGLVIVRTGSITTDWDESHLPNLIINSLKQSAP